MDMNTMSAATGMCSGAIQRGTGFFRASTASKRPGSPPISTKTVGRPWTKRETDVHLEKWLYLLLAIAAVIGITYGFSCLIDLVQNWAAMERGISNLI